MVEETPPPQLMLDVVKIMLVSPTELGLGLSLAIIQCTIFIGPEEMPILVVGWPKRPPTKMGST